MAWPSVPKGFLGARRYSARFHYPLSSYEQWFWQVGTSLPKPKRNQPVNRSRQEQISTQKLDYLQSVLCYLQSNPFILAIFVTGSLAMHNCQPDDDIDLMFITKPRSLWLARLWNIFSLSRHGLRRPPYLPEHNSPIVKDKLCDNLYLENLTINQVTNNQLTNLYIAHEILQAKPIYDPYGQQRQFLIQNSWVGEYLPIAYRETLKKSPQIKSFPKTGLLDYWIIGSLNYLAFILQYMYMRPKITSEKVTLTQAFFHPNKVL